MVRKWQVKLFVINMLFHFDIMDNNRSYDMLILIYGKFGTFCVCWPCPSADITLSKRASIPTFKGHDVFKQESLPKTRISFLLGSSKVPFGIHQPNFPRI